ncbi:hypothetical protein B0H15DRAFT_972108 [Mycena belliarum]|uniref:Uncharacterized protein n=1 Tax=Mycena belliarum TaxID=1033014 RepID=A0AAD6XKP3_9AGAR|nr:hypothetical protein B0H15DRAFT_972108 [Mycena belliae]
MLILAESTSKCHLLLPAYPPAVYELTLEVPHHPPVLELREIPPALALLATGDKMGVRYLIIITFCAFVPQFMGSVLPCPLILADTFAQVTLVEADDTSPTNTARRARARRHRALLRRLRLVQHATALYTILSGPKTLASSELTWVQPHVTAADALRRTPRPRCASHRSYTAAPPTSARTHLYASTHNARAPQPLGPQMHLSRRPLRAATWRPVHIPTPATQDVGVRKATAVAYSATPVTLRAQLPRPLALHRTNAGGHILASTQSAQVLGGMGAARPRPPLLPRAPDPHVLPAASLLRADRLQVALSSLGGGAALRERRGSWRQLARIRAPLGAGVGRVKGVGRPLRAGRRFARAQVRARTLQRAPRRRPNGAGCAAHLLVAATHQRRGIRWVPIARIRAGPSPGGPCGAAARSSETGKRSALPVGASLLPPSRRQACSLARNPVNSDGTFPPTSGLSFVTYVS